jgi:hypothetical protein
LRESASLLPQDYVCNVQRRCAAQLKSRESIFTRSATRQHRALLNLKNLKIAATKNKRRQQAADAVSVVSSLHALEEAFVGGIQRSLKMSKISLARSPILSEYIFHNFK